MNQIVPFNFEAHEIRIVLRDGEPWWALRDICGTLEIVNASDAAGRLEDDEKGVVQTDTLGGPQKITVISEPGLYRLIMRSDKPVAKRFQRWVFHDVLPQIRKTGSYIDKKRTAGDLLVEMAVNFRDMERRVDKIEGVIENLGAHEDFKSIKAYAALIGRKITTKESGEFGRAATALSKQIGQKIGRQPDEAFGFVNTYHRDILQQVFGQRSVAA